MFPFRNGSFLFLNDIVNVGQNFLLYVKEFVQSANRPQVCGWKIFRTCDIFDECHDENWILTSVTCNVFLDDISEIVQITPDTFCCEALLFNEIGQFSRVNIDKNFLTNSYRTISQGRPYLTCGITLFSDEWGGSKRGVYNKFESVYSTLSFLPRRYRNLAQFCWHVVSSNVVDFVPLFNASSNMIKQTLQKGFTVFAADLKEQVFVDGDLFAIVADNPRQQDICNCAQSSATSWCRKCLGKKGDIFSDAPLRDYNQTRATVDELIQATSSTSKDTSPVDPITGVKSNGINNLSEHSGFQPHSDCVVEILHTILLGLPKYVTKETMKALSLNQQEKFLALLRSDKFSGFAKRLNANPIKNWKSFQGGEWKILVQIMPYLLHGCGASKEILDGWLIISELSKYAYKLSFDSNLKNEPHPNQIRVAIKCLLKIFPSLKKKFKLHLIAQHMQDDFIIYGLLVNASSERFEAMNKIIRKFYSSSNLHSPGRDIARCNAKISVAQFLICGGQWIEKGNAICAGEAIVALKEHPAFKKVSLLKNPASTKSSENSRLCLALRDRNRNQISFRLSEFELSDTLIQALTNQLPTLPYHESSNWRVIQYGGLQNNSLIRAGSECRLSGSSHGTPLYGIFQKAVRIVGCQELSLSMSNWALFS
eukprot:Pompholyxophrys_punicea_v1_NODE_158_length_3125_cov_4.844300.p1 type:complete len:652 gc:universal NODE_158_length_3125_cov_4.844300:620-2575(+)